MASNVQIKQIAVVPPLDPLGAPPIQSTTKTTERIEEWQALSIGTLRSMLISFMLRSHALYNSAQTVKELPLAPLAPIFTLFALDSSTFSYLVSSPTPASFVLRISLPPFVNRS